MILPKNENKQKDITPKNYFIWGQSMSGKTYLACKFPNPLLINTDGNGKKIETPSIEITNFQTFVKVLEEIEKGQHTFETIIIDLIDDIKIMLDKFICEEHNVDHVSNIKMGKGWYEVRTTWNQLIMRLTKIKYNIIFISHVIQVSDIINNNTYEMPSLDQKSFNSTMGRCDVSIKCTKIGEKFLQICDGKRENYKKEDIQNEQIYNILKNVTNCINAENATLKKINK